MAERSRVLGVFIEVMRVNKKKKYGATKVTHLLVDCNSSAIFVTIYRQSQLFFLENGSFQIAFAVKRRDACH